MFRGGGWGNWRRGSDYYEEGELIWLEVANIIHDRSHGQKSFEDFYRAFYGGPNNGPEVKPYTLDDIVSGLNQVVPYDWASFFHERLTSNAPEAPLNGIEEGGWKLEFSPEKPKAGRTGPRGPNNTTYTIGLSVNPEGMVTDSIYDGRAFKAGISPGMKIVGVNGRLFTPEILADAISASKDSQNPIEVLLVDDDYYRTAKIDYRGGDRYPHLVRDDSKPDYIDDLVKPEAR
jgi:predicted metalloprotease with PDZ domain